MEKVPRVTVGALVFNSEGKVLLLKSPKWDGRYVCPFGHVEYGEKLMDAVRREVMEETALSVDGIKMLKTMELIESEQFHDKDRHFVCVNFTCKTVDREVKLNEESTSFSWLNPQDALTRNLDSVTRRSIVEFLSRD